MGANGYQYFTNRLPLHHNGFNKIFTNHYWYKLVKTNTLFYNGKTFGNRNNALVTIGKSLVESSI